MSKHGFKDNVTFAGYNDIFKTEDDYLEISDEQVVEIRLNQLFEFKNHPFRVVNDEKMKEMIESIKQHGVLMPGIVRERAEGGYEIIAGHRRKFASEMAGKETMPVIIRDISDDEATIIMVDTNIQREDILPSEKARAYSMKYEAMKHQEFTDITQLSNCVITYVSSDGTERQKWLDATDQYLTGESSPPKGVTILGGKTGTTAKAGACLALMVQNNYGEPFVSIVLNAENKPILYERMNQLLESMNRS